jgi:hypothetical protein
MPCPPNQCIVLVPVGGRIEPPCEESLRALEVKGYPVRRVYGYANVDQARNEIVSQALHDGFQETMWIDSDVGFHPDDVDKLRAYDLPIACGIYAKKGRRALAVHVLPGSERIQFGKGGGLYEIRYAATGFLHVRREVYESTQKKLNLPICNTRFGERVVPYFQPLVIRDERPPAANAIPSNGEDHWYLGDDYSFCERVRQAGFKIIADSTIRLMHYGTYGFSWEEAGTDVMRYASYDYRLS